MYSSPSSLGWNFALREDRWVVQIGERLAEGSADGADDIPASIFNVPEAMRNARPLAYTPQVVAVGPYHYWRPKLYELEQYKLRAARRVQTRLPTKRLEDVVERFKQRAGKIRAHYQRYLDFSDETLSWMMAVDACFLLDLLQIYVDASVRPPNPSIHHLYPNTFHSSTSVSVVRDVMMLENQLPLFLLQDILTILTPVAATATDPNVSSVEMLTTFMKELMPFKSMAVFPDVDVTSAHLLHVLYRLLVPEELALPHSCNDDGDTVEYVTETSPPPPPDSSSIKELLKTVFDIVVSKPTGFLKRVLSSRPAKVAVLLPWNRLLSLVRRPEAKVDVEDDDGGQPPLVEEILIPSVKELMRAGVQFRPTDGGLSSIGFDAKTAVFSLPVVTLDTTTEVVLRNLVAYEAAACRGPLVLARYTELMNGIVDTEDDVQRLRRSGIMNNRMKSDAEVAEAWNGMSKATMLTKVESIDRAIKDANAYYNGRWKVKVKRVMRRYLYDSWRILAMLATVLLLLLNTLQAICSVYTCKK